MSIEPDQLNFSAARYRNNLKHISSMFPMIYQALRKHSTVVMNDKSLSEYCLKSMGVKTINRIKETIDDKTHVMIDNIDHELAQPDITAFNLPGPNLYEYPRLFMRAIDNLVDELERYTTPNENSETNKYRCLPEKALIILYGTPTFKGLQHLIKRYSVLNLIIVCPSIDEFITSLITEKWAAFLQEVNNSSLSLQVLLSDANNPELEFGLVWNELIKRNPFFLLQSVYINIDPNRDNSFRALTHHIQKDMNIYLSGWGNYDDEVNQIKQTICNAHHITRVLKSDKIIKNNLPVMIIGSGPSLDKNIDLIKGLDGNCFLISCATALTALYKNGITPDVHIETESDFVRINMLDNLGDADYLKSISLIAPIQISPTVGHYFKEHIVYALEHQPLSESLKAVIPIIKPIGTNCLNHAIHIANLVGFKTIYLTGFDLGFLHSGQHHSEHTIYFDDNAHKLFKEGADYKGRVLRNIHSFEGKQMLTDPFMDAARIYFERYLNQHVHLRCFNLSHGASIKGVIDIDIKTLKSHFATFDYDHIEAINIVESMSTLIDQNHSSMMIFTIINQKIPLVQELRNAVLDISRLLKVKHYPFQDRMLSLLNTINRYLEHDLKKRCYPVYRLIRGSYYHFMSVGLSYYLTITRVRGSDHYFFDLWSNHLYQFGKNMTAHFTHALLDDDLDDVTLFNRSLSDPETVYRHQ